MDECHGGWEVMEMSVSWGMEVVDVSVMGVGSDGHGCITGDGGGGCEQLTGDGK